MSNAFNILDLPESFEIDRSKLDQHYYAKLALHHPDKLINADEKKKQASHEEVLNITQAYEVLKSDYSRSKELLKLVGINNEGQQSDEFLNETMELWESLHTAETELELQELLASTKARLENYWQEIAAAFKSKNYQKAQTLLSEINFLNSYLNEIRTKFET